MKKSRYADADEEFRNEFYMDYLDKRRQIERRDYSGRLLFGIAIVGILALSGYAIYKMIDSATNYREKIEQQMNEKTKK